MDLGPSPFGAPMRRREDPRLITGAGRYVGDLFLPRLLHVAFVRSAHAHARLRSLDTTVAVAQAGVVAVVTGRDALVGGRGVRARSALPGYVETEQPLLAWPVVRHVGEAVAAVVGVDRYAVEDAAGLVAVDYEPLPAVIDALEALAAGAPRVHESAGDNRFLSRRFEQGNVEAALAGAAVVVERRFRTNRQCAAPLEGRGGVAEWSAADGRLT